MTANELLIASLKNDIANCFLLLDHVAHDNLDVRLHHHERLHVVQGELTQGKVGQVQVMEGMARLTMLGRSSSVEDSSTESDLRFISCQQN